MVLAKRESPVLIALASIGFQAAAIAVVAAAVHVFELVAVGEIYVVSMPHAPLAGKLEAWIVVERLLEKPVAYVVKVEGRDTGMGGVAAVDAVEEAAAAAFLVA